MAVALSGSIVLTGSITGSLLGTSSYSSNAGLLNGLDSSVFALTSSLSTFSSSLNGFTSSINTYTASNNDSIADIRVATASLYAVTASINSYTASNNANIAALNAATASLYNATASLYLTTASLNQYTASLNTRSASFACIDSTNNFGCVQYFSNASNAVSFTSTGSLYSDGGMRLTKDLYVSGTSYFNNVTIFGTQSVNYITSSQLNIASNIITVNTATPTVRFGGLAVYDSGSLGTGLTGSILWDSENNHWVYSNPSGSSYSGGMFISGPRSAALGSEQGTTACALMMGQGGDHITSSAIFHYGNATCFYNNASITSAGAACFASTISLGDDLTLASTNPQVKWNAGNLRFTSLGIGDVVATITQAGIACFANTVCAPAFVGGTGYYSLQICSTGNSNTFGAAGSPGRALIVQAGCTNGTIMFKNCSGGDGTIFVDGTSTSLDYKFNTYSTGDAFVIKNGGNVGIGTVSPNTKLEVAGTIRVSSNGTNGGDWGVDDSGIAISSRGSTPIAFWTNDFTNQRLRITAAGIACFACQVCAPNHIAMSSCSTAGLRVYGASGTHQWDMYLNGNNIRFSDNTSGGCFVVDTTSTFGGYVGIGTSPLTKLHLYDSSPNYIVLTNTGADGVSNAIQGGIIGQARGYGNNLAQMANILFRNKNTAAWYKGEITFSTNDSDGTNPAVSPVERLRIFSDGVSCFSSTVCVGGALVVNGATINVNCDNTTATDARINLYTRNSVNGDRASIYTYNLSATTGGCELTYLAFGYCCTNNQGYINMQTKSGGAWCNTMNIINGSVGIGTTSPSYKLDISTAQSIRVVGSSTGYTQGSIIFQSSTTDTPEARGLGVYAFNEGTDATWFYGTAYNAADSFVINRKAGTTYQDAAASVGEACNFLLIKNNGRVGIGTTTPCTILSVNSGISVSSGNAISIMQNTNGANKDAAAFGVSINNGGESTNAADLYISTATGGSLAERMRITSAGNVLVGCTVQSRNYNGPGCRYNFTSLNTPQQLEGICANNGIIVIRDHTTGGTGAFLIDPNMGVICIASNIPATVAIAYHSSAGMWCWCLTSGSVPRCLGYGFYGA